jgi:hypothetical protein
LAAAKVARHGIGKIAAPSPTALLAAADRSTRRRVIIPWLRGITTSFPDPRTGSATIGIAPEAVAREYLLSVAEHLQQPGRRLEDGSTSRLWTQDPRCVPATVQHPLNHHTSSSDAVKNHIIADRKAAQAAPQVMYGRPPSGKKLLTSAAHDLERSCIRPVDAVGC